MHDTPPSPTVHNGYPKGHPERTRVLLVYDLYGWVLGKWARTISRLFSADIDFVLSSMYLLNTNETFFTRLIEQMDVVHLLLPHPFPSFRAITREPLLITTIHHWVAWGEVYQQAIKGSDHIVADSSIWKQRLVEKGVPEPAVTVVRHGIDNVFFEPSVPLVAPSVKLSVGFFAKMSSNEVDRKGTRHFRALVACMAAHGIAHFVRFIVAGPGWRDFVAETQAMGVEILYQDYLADDAMPALFQSLDAYLVLSDVEGGPATIAEAMASRCLVLTTRVGVALDVVQDGETGIFIDTADIPAIAEQLAVIARYRDAFAPLVERAHAVAAHRLRATSTFAPLAPLYQQAIGRPRSSNRAVLDVDGLNTSIAHLSPTPL